MRKLYMSMILLTVASTALADIDWRVITAPVTGPNDPLNKNETIFSIPLTGSSFVPENGFLAQLLYAGADNVIDPADLNAPTGVGGDDLVVATRWFGAGRFPNPENGYFTAGNAWGGGADDALDDLSTGRNFFMRAWVGGSQDPAQVQLGLPTARIPNLNVAGLLWYGNSALFLNPGDDPEGDGGAPTITGVDFGALGGQGGGAFLANQVIPEPASLLLLLLGAAILGRRARRS